MTATPTATPPLLKTYQEARLVWEAKGWGLVGAAEELGEKPELERFHITHTKLSRKTTPGTDSPLEPEVAAAVERMPTRRGYERQVEIVMKGLRALQGAPPPPASQRIGQRAFRFLRKLAERLGRAAWTRIAITAASGALVGCLALLVAPLLHRANAAQPGPLMVVAFSPAGDNARHLDPRSLLDMPAKWGEKPLDQTIPNWTLPGQRVAPCDEGLGEEVINGNCWAAMKNVTPPCGRLFRHGDTCYRPIAADPKKPVEAGGDH